MDTKLLKARAVAAEALALLLVARTIRATIPMRRWQRLVGQKSAASGRVEQAIPPTDPIDLRVARAIQIATNHSPVAMVCLDQAVAGSWMLRLRGERPTMVIGLKADDLAATPHAWLIADSGATITGGGARPGFASVTAFQSTARS